jgi:hypothetical protein
VQKFVAIHVTEGSCRSWVLQDQAQSFGNRVRSQCNPQRPRGLYRLAEVSLPLVTKAHYQLDWSERYSDPFSLNAKASEPVSHESRSQSHFTTDGQSVCLGVEGSGTCEQIFFFFFSEFLSCLCGAPSLARGRVCLLSVICQYPSIVSMYIRYLH